MFVIITTEKQDTFKTGDKIEVFIILRDGYKKQREKGGDDLRVRTFNDDLNAYAAGQVKDHNNGTYTASVLAHWSGKHFIEVMLVHTRESIRALYQIRKNVSLSLSARSHEQFFFAKFGSSEKNMPM